MTDPVIDSPSNSLSNDTAPDDSLDDQVVEIDVHRRQPILGVILLGIFLPISIFSTILVYQGMQLMSRGSVAGDSDQFYESTRHALAFGPRDQRLDIIRHLGDQGTASVRFEDDLAAIASADDEELAAAADIALRQITGSGF